MGFWLLEPAGTSYWESEGGGIVSSSFHLQSMDGRWRKVAMRTETLQAAEQTTEQVKMIISSVRDAWWHFLFNKLFCYFCVSLFCYLIHVLLKTPSINVKSKVQAQTTLSKKKTKSKPKQKKFRNSCVGQKHRMKFQKTGQQWEERTWSKARPWRKACGGHGWKIEAWLQRDGCSGVPLVTSPHSERVNFWNVLKRFPQTAFAELKQVWGTSLPHKHLALLNPQSFQQSQQSSILIYGNIYQFKKYFDRKIELCFHAQQMLSLIQPIKVKHRIKGTFLLLFDLVYLNSPKRLNLNVCLKTLIQ